ncbi:O-antigen ligase family protein [Maricaulis sp.]|uniref:O-antigen ligase family protein n=1 Tax=Maricaulis sp. TaxID=1486257 RepID=UPI00261FD601|nr:O-antigen ligase family protein [Maricaulis sp.]
MSRAVIIRPPLLEALRQAPSLPLGGAIERAGAFIALFLFSQGLVGPFFADPADPESSVVLRLIWLPVYALTLVFMALHPGRTVAALLRSPAILALAGLTLVSVVWSVAPDVSLRRGFALFMTTLFGLWLASRWDWPVLITLIASVFASLAVASTLMAVLMPSLGVDQAVHAGAWKGVWWEKNTLGAMMAWGSVAALAALNNDPRRAWLWAGAAVLCSALVVLSTSKTALLAWALGCGLVALVGFCRQGFGFAVMCLTLAVCGFALAILILLIAPLEMLELLGRDATLTGRTEIWAALIREVQSAPWTGYGYNAFWAADNGPVFWVRQETAWDVPTAHNGWIETALAIGLPGVILMALVYLQAMARALGRMFTGGEAYWALPFLAMFGLVSISESNLLEQNGLSWVLFVATAAALARRRA